MSIPRFSGHLHVVMGDSGGGGGAGVTGGGGGGSNDAASMTVGGGGGGGGSSSGPSGTVFQTGAQTGNGKVTISY